MTLPRLLVVEEYNSLQQARDSIALGYRRVSTAVESLSLTFGRADGDTGYSAACALLKGRGCPAYHSQEPIPSGALPRGNKSCILDCNHVGTCVATAGFCQCPMGWTGDGCHIRLRRPCTNKPRSWGLEQIDPGPENLTAYRPPNNPFWSSKAAMCSGACDKDMGMCYCPSHTLFGHIPAGEGSLPGKYDEENQPINFGMTERDWLYGAKGWCMAEEPEHRCSCFKDGIGGPLCNIPTEQTCPNQCNGHGECQQGYCKCQDGWFGQDCAYRVQGVPDSPGTLACMLGAWRTLMHSRMENSTRPWIKQFVHTPAAREPGARGPRLRPLIWVYELPTDYSSLMLQYRVERDHCVTRTFSDDNSTVEAVRVYQLEMGLHEMMLQSSHRTLDPEEADFFYVPLYTACYIQPVVTWGDGPFYYGPIPGRTIQATGFMEEAYHQLRSRYPYWDRKGGRDHIIYVPHDEASCYVPKALRSAIILSHWGRQDSNHTSWTGHAPDNYSVEAHDPLWLPKGHLHRINRGPCFDAEKGELRDLVLPDLHNSHFHAHSPLMGNPTVHRKWLALFKGRLQVNVGGFLSGRETKGPHRMKNLPYSQGVRQKIALVSREEDWLNNHGILYGDHEAFDGLPSYSQLMSESTFCLAIIGDGYTSRYEDAITHGCIPVVIMDNVSPTLGTIINEADISVRVAFKDVERLPQILKAIPRDEIERLQRNIGRVWRRFLWSSYPLTGPLLQAQLDANLARFNGTEDPSLLPARDTAHDMSQGDAFQTLMEWLYGRMDP
ncbi:putative glucuronoxylan glucuronosyltransferase F8H [Auxenochlorella protothecoides]|uniref:Putative glucuronoxylan glucuronosyltransferase F8H n=1 Tax=Auxenochlorella protothecoides TaxID=3075 RepID=A0A087SGL7_AUXPR|nr:putative glucuronoxylan glucuronosyltransferase F8H [Auxenochlorella protothecoides]KFM24871.1 putative glucuronoxylan glucuronosyltransferase F8H [Auxenochlorella protothecoides]